MPRKAELTKSNRIKANDRKIEVMYEELKPKIRSWEQLKELMSDYTSLEKNQSYYDCSSINDYVWNEKKSNFIPIQNDD